MAVAIKMPKMSDTMTEGVIAEWLKKVGDTVKSGDIIAEVETDKATMELENYEDGTILYISVQKGEAVPVDGVIAIVGTVGESYDALLGGAAPVQAAPVVTATPSSAAPVSAPAVAMGAVNAVAVRMPKMSDTMTEGTIVAWLKKVGDAVKSGDIIAEVETDKATMELENYEDGTLLYVGIEAGNAVKVDDIIAIVGEPGANYQVLLNGSASITAAVETPSTAPAPATPSTVDTPEVSSAHNNSDGRVKASPLAKKLAQDKGIDLAQVAGSGENGRIVKRDVDGFVPSAKPAAQPTAAPVVSSGAVFGEESFEEVPVSQMRKTIARRLGESKFTAPHFYLTMEIVMDKAIAARGSMNEVSPVKLSFNDLVIKATAVALSQHPKVNSSWLGDKIRYNHHIHIGMAVAVEEGLLVPVIRFANFKSLSQISAEAKDLGGKAKSKKLTPAEMQGNTFTISNLGMFGIDEFTAIINPPDACILAVGGIKEDVRVKDGQFYATNIMKVTLSCDHRVVDGASGAAFLQTLKSLLEDPVRLLI